MGASKKSKLIQSILIGLAISIIVSLLSMGGRLKHFENNA